MPECAPSAQPWQGAGEPAPWAEMDLAQQPQQLKQAEQLNQHGGVGAHQGAEGAEVQQHAVLPTVSHRRCHTCQWQRRLQACLRQGSLVLRARPGEAG
jgi:hypothetical protein